MLGDHFPLLEQAWGRRERATGGQRPGLAEDPRVADRAPGDGHAVDAGLGDHVQAILGRKQVAASQHRPVARVLFHFLEERPRTAAFVPLPNGTAVDGNGCCAQLEGTIEDGEELVAAFLAFVHAASHFDGDRNLCPHRLADPGDDLHRPVRIAEQVAATALAEDFSHRAAEVDIDRVEPRFHQLQRSGGELARITAHQLRPDRMIFVRHPDEPLCLLPFGHVEHKAVEQHLRHGVSGPQPPCDNPGRPVGIPTHRGQHDGELDGHRPEAELGEVANHIYD